MALSFPSRVAWLLAPPAFLLLAAFPAMAQFAPALPVAPFGPGQGLIAVDLDGDGDLDLVKRSGTDHLQWIHHVDGAGAFEVQGTWFQTPGTIAHFTIADLNGDGAADLAFIEEDEHVMMVAMNDGTGILGEPMLVGGLPGEVGALRVGDITSNGRPDLVLTLEMDGDVRIGWFPGQEAGFGALATTATLFPGNAPAVMLLGDLDLSGGIDVFLMADALSGVGVMNGAGDASIWDVLPLFINFNGPFSDPQLIDVDGDGDLDIADASGSSIQWAENRLDENVPFNAFTLRHLEGFTTAGQGRFGRTPCDAGAAVVWVPANPALPVRWRQYLGGLFGFSPARDLPSIPRGNGLLLADLDGDGVEDLILGDDTGISWYRNVMPEPTATVALPVLDTLCIAGPSVPLPDALPSGGMWSGTWVSDNMLHRSNAPGSGSYPLGYTWYEPEGCPVGDRAFIQLIMAPVVTPALGPVICSGDGPIQMGSVPQATEWIGLAEGAILDPATYAGETIVCAYTDPTGSTCIQILGTLSVWATIPAAIQPTGPFCVNDGLQEIVPEVQLPNSSWSGDIVSSTEGSALFDPSQGAGLYQVILVRMPTGPQQCMGTDTLVIVVSDDIPELSLVPIAPHCAGGVPIALLAEPAGGLWSGTGVIEEVFYPTLAGAGTHVLTYFYEAPEGCSNTAHLEVILADAATVQGPSASWIFCRSGEPVTFSGFPAGGTWQAPLDENGVFDPGATAPGEYPVGYTYTDPAGCVLQSGPATLQVLFDATVVIDPVGLVCLDGGPVTLTGNPPGIWGGAASGFGSMALFDPAFWGEGLWTVTLTSEPEGFCAGTATIQVEVELCTGLDDLTATMGLLVAPNPFATGFRVEMTGEGPLTYEILDAMGRSVDQGSYAADTARPLWLDLSGQPDGTYLLRVVRHGRIAHAWLVKAG